MAHGGYGKRRVKPDGRRSKALGIGKRPKSVSLKNQIRSTERMLRKVFRRFHQSYNCSLRELFPSLFYCAVIRFGLGVRVRCRICVTSLGFLLDLVIDVQFGCCDQCTIAVIENPILVAEKALESMRLLWNFSY